MQQKKKPYGIQTFAPLSMTGGLDNASDVISIGADKRYGAAHAKAARDAANTFKPSGRDNVSGFAYLFNQVRAPFAERYAADKEAAKTQAVVDALKKSGGWSDDEVALLATGEPTIMQGLMNARNKREYLAAKTAADIRLAERKAELEKEAGGKSGSAWMEKRTAVERPVLDKDGNPVIDFATGKPKTTVEYYTRNLKEPNSPLQKVEIPGGGRILSESELEELKYAARVRGKDYQENAIVVPKVQANARATLDTINQIKDPEKIARFVGFINGNMPLASAEAKEFEALMQALEGQAFLTAFEALKGGGQITEIEGAKATQAYMRARRAQSPEAFVKALQDYRAIVNRTVVTAKALAGDPDAQREASTWYNDKEEAAALKEWNNLYKKDPEAAYRAAVGLPPIDKKEAERDRAEGTPPRPTAADLPPGMRWVD